MRKAGQPLADFTVRADSHECGKMAVAPLPGSGAGHHSQRCERENPNPPSIHMRVQTLGSFTLVELLVVVAIIGILSSLLLPALSKARDYAKSSGCNANQRQLGIAFTAYADDYDGYYPVTAEQPGAGAYQEWWYVLLPYVSPKQISKSSVFVCPGGNDSEIWTSWSQYYSYAANWAIGQGMTIRKRVGDIRTPSEMSLLMDGTYKTAWWHSYYINIAYRHMKGANVLFADGHASWQKGPFPNSSTVFWTGQ